MELSTIVEGQTLGTVHIMEGTCSRLRFFFVRNMTTDMCTYTYTYTIMYTYIYKNTCAKNKCDYAVEWLVVWLGGVVWCSAVCCCRGVLVLGILKLEIGKIQGFLSVNL